MQDNISSNNPRSTRNTSTRRIYEPLITNPNKTSDNRKGKTHTPQQTSPQPAPPRRFICIDSCVFCSAMLATISRVNEVPRKKDILAAEKRQAPLSVLPE